MFYADVGSSLLSFQFAVSYFYAYFYLSVEYSLQK